MKPLPLPVLSAPQTVRKSQHPGIHIPRGRQLADEAEQRDRAERLAAPKETPNAG